MLVVDHGAGGPANVLHVAQVAMPEPGPGQVLVKVQYAGVNRPDLLQRAGSYPPPKGASPYLGLEVSGTISAVGQGVSSWQIGDAVCALTPGGGYAQYCLVSADHCLPIPKGLDMLQASVLPETYFTVWANVFERGGLKRGESLLVHGGSSGIGITAIQLAKEMGARVFTTVGNQDKADACLQLGADQAILYREQDFVEVIRQATDKRGVDIILDMVGGDYVARNLRCLALEGRLVQIAFLQGSRVDIDLMPIMIKRLRFTGSTLRARPDAEKALLAQQLQGQVWPILAAGRCLPVIHKVFSFEQAAQAHELMESSQHIGKIALQFS